MMQIIAERSIFKKVNPAIRKLTEWDFVFAIKWVTNILDEPYVQIDYVSNGKRWKIPFPYFGGTMFIIDYKKHKNLIETFAGAAWGDGNKKLDNDKASVIVFGDETEEVLELRIVHEFLHAEDLPADDLDKHVHEFLPFWLRWVYIFLKNRRKSPEHLPYFQRKYYRWLLNQRKERVM